MSTPLTEGSASGSLPRHGRGSSGCCNGHQSFFREMNTELSQCLPHEEDGMVCQANVGREQGGKQAAEVSEGQILKGLYVVLYMGCNACLYC